MNADSADTHYQQGLAHSKRGSFKKAAAEFAQAIALEPNNPVYYFERGEAYAAENNNVLALQDFDRAVELNPTFIKAYLSRAVIRSHSNENGRVRNLDVTGSARADYATVIALDPDSYNAYMKRGMIYYSLGEFEQAIRDLGEAARCRPDLDLALLNRGRARRQIGDVSGAIDDFYAAFKLKHGSPRHIWAQPDTVVFAELNAEIERTPNRVACYVLRGQAYHWQMRDDLALADLQTAIQITPDDPFLYLFRAIQYHKQDDFQLAIPDYQFFIAAYPNSPKGYLGLGQVYLTLSEMDTGIPLLEHTLELMPNSALANDLRRMINRAKSGLFP